MADYIYLLQTRLTPAQRTALQHVREAAKSRAMTVFLVGGAVRDLSSGSPIRDLDFAVQGNATQLKKDLQKAGGTLTGEDDAAKSVFLSFPGGVRVEIGSTMSVSFTKPGKPVYKPATILDDLRRRDFTANAMAISLNDGSYGLLMDPLNGVADLENRELRLVSNYGFIEDPARMIRAARFGARLGWTMEARTQQRYDNGKAENYIAALNPFQQSYELEEIFHEEDPLRVLRRLESEGWATHLSPVLASARANEAELSRLRDTVGQMEAMGIHPDPSAAYFPLLTAKLAPKEVATLKSSFARSGFATQIDALDSDTKAFATEFTSKAAAAPSDAWKMLFSAAPEPTLWLAHTTKCAPIKARFEAFFNDWSQARQKIPYQLMQEMRIVPELPVYAELMDKLFFAIMDGKLDTPEAARAFLEPYSPPAPPPPVNLRRRAVKRETKPAKSRAKKVAAPLEDVDVDLDIAAAAAPSTPPPVEPAKPAPAKAAPAKVASVKPAPTKVASVKPAEKPVPAKLAPVKAATPAVKAAAPAVKIAAKAPAKAVAQSKSPLKAAAKKTIAPFKAAAKKVAPLKAAAKKTVKAVEAKVPAKVAAKSSIKSFATARKSAKPVAKKIVVPVKAAARKAPVKVAPKKVSKPAPKKLASKPVAKKIVAKKAAPAPKKASKPAPKPAKKVASKSKAKARR